MGTTKNAVVVIGSCMIDLLCYADRLPRAGETIQGNRFVIGHGGKGANQCVAARKLGANSLLIARLGNDSFGVDYKKSLEERGIDTKYLTLTENTSSGMAQITVSESGENHIVIVPGANNHLSVSDVINASADILDAKVVLFQFETPLDTTVKALEYISSKNSGNTTVIVNAAPAVSLLDPKIFKLCHIFCVNETEAEEICQMSVKNVEEAKQVIRKLIEMGCQTVVVTLGKHGAVFGSAGVEQIDHVATRSVVPVDTTGAGDAFLGALAFYLAYFSQIPLKEMIRRSCVVASASVTKPGTQSSYPHPDELPADLFQ